MMICNSKDGNKVSNYSHNPVTVKQYKVYKNNIVVFFFKTYSMPSPFLPWVWLKSLLKSMTTELDIPMKRIYWSACCLET